MNYRTHISIQRIVTVEFWGTCYGSDAIGVLRVIQLQTDVEYASGSEMQSLDSLDFAPNAWIHDSPLMMPSCTVELSTVLDVERQKQMEHMVMQDQCNNKFRVWSRIQEVWWILVLECSWMIWENWMNFDLICDEMIFC